MMRSLFRLLWTFERPLAASRNRWNRYRFLWLEACHLRSVSVGRKVSFQVPVMTRGALGSITVGDRNVFGFWQGHRLGNGNVLLQPRTPEAEIVIGDGNVFNNNAALIASARIEIGKHCLVGDLVSIYDSDFHELDPVSRWGKQPVPEPVVIGSNVWLGSRVLVLKGVTIGDNSAVAAMSVVTRPVPANTLVAGVPAKILRQLN